METYLLEIATNTGPVITAVVYAFYSLQKRVTKLEDTFSRKLENGIRTEINNIRADVAECRIEIAQIEGRCSNCPSNHKKGN